MPHLRRGVLLLTGNLFIDESKLHLTVSPEQQGKQQQACGQQPRRLAKNHKAVHRGLQQVTLLVKKQQRPQSAIDHDGQHPPEDATIDQRANHQVELAVGHDEQQATQQQRECQRPATTACQHNNDIRQEESQPKPVICADD